MAIFLRGIAAVLIFAAVRDVFHTLFHPAKQGAVSDWIARSIWVTVRFISRRSLSFAGPLAFVTIVLYWALSIIVGFALIYLPALPQDFSYANGLRGEGFASFLGALNISIGSLITLSTGVYSKVNWIGLMMGVESIIGFGLLTASVSWILSIYPILEHRKSLAREATLLHFAEAEGIRRLEQVSDSEVQQILMGLASQLITGRNELVQFPITYYFHEDDKQTSIAGILPYLADIADQNARRSGGAAVAAVALGGAVDDYLRIVAHIFLDDDFSGRDEILRALADDHLRKVIRSPYQPPRAA